MIEVCRFSFIISRMWVIISFGMISITFSWVYPFLTEPFAMKLMLLFRSFSNLSFVSIV